MQTAQIKEQFSAIEQCVDNAARACQLSNRVSDELRICLSELDNESDQVKHLAETENDEQRLLQCVDRLEELSGRALEACHSSDGHDQQLQSAVTQAHEAICSLKRQLH